MPLRKKVVALKRLCLENFAKRIVYHGERFQKSEESGRTHGSYKTIQRFFTDIVVVKFSTALSQKDRQDEKTKEFINIFFYGEKTGNPSDWPCLQFLFNEYTTSVSALFSKQHKFPEETLTYISSTCKNLKIFNPASGNMFLTDICKVISQFQYLEYVDVGRLPCRTDILTILEMCPLLTNLSIQKSELTDEIFLSLCKHSSQGDKFQFCPENGNCSTMGKNLQVFHCNYWPKYDVLNSNYIAPGLACALQHFPKLNSFAQQNIIFTMQTLYMPIAILTLQDSAQENGKPFIHLELTGLFLSRAVCADLEPLQLRRICLSCPKLEYLQVGIELNSRDFLTSTFKNVKQLLLFGGFNGIPSTPDIKHLLAAQGTKITALHICMFSSIDVNHINDILNVCCNLKELSVHCITLTGQILYHSRKMFHAAASLEKISLYISAEIEANNSFLYELLCSAQSLKNVTLASYTAEQEFFFAMKKNDFSCLEELHIFPSEFGKMCLDRLMNQKNCLRKICLFTSSYMERLKMIAAQNNYDLKIVYP